MLFCSHGASLFPCSLRPSAATSKPSEWMSKKMFMPHNASAAYISSALLILMIGCKPSTSPRATPPSTPEKVISTAPSTAEISASTCTIETVLEPGIPGSPGHLIASTINPNGDSQLAVLMRNMRDDLRATREQLLQGKPPGGLLKEHSQMRCVWPTDPSVRNTKYDEMASTYLYAVDDLERAKTPKDRKMAYGRVLNGCVTCHQNTCPGPIASIVALELPE